MSMRRADSGYDSQSAKRVQKAKKSTSKLLKYSMKARPSRGDNVISITRTFHVNEFFYPDTLCTDGGGYQKVLRIVPTLNSFPSYTDFTALFDEYRIVDCNVKIIPRYTDNTSASNDNSMTILSWFTDHNEVSTAWNSVEGLWMEREDLKQTLFNKEVNIKFSPRPINPVFSTPSTSYASIQAPQWINGTDSTVPHYGLALRMYAPNASIAFAQNMANVYVTCTFQFRQPK